MSVNTSKVGTGDGWGREKEDRRAYKVSYLVSLTQDKAILGSSQLHLLLTGLSFCLFPLVFPLGEKNRDRGEN